MSMREQEYLVLFCFVSWHINHYWLSNAKSCFSIYIKYMICKHILYDIFKRA